VKIPAKKFAGLQISLYHCRTIQIHHDMKATPVFKVFKKGMTDKPIIIMRVDGHPFDEAEKRAKYIGLGYTIIEVK
jgi:hypothetical protein